MILVSVALPLAHVLLVALACYATLSSLASQLLYSASQDSNKAACMHGAGATPSALWASLRLLTSAGGMFVSAVTRHRVPVCVWS